MKKKLSLILGGLVFIQPGGNGTGDTLNGVSHRAAATGLQLTVTPVNSTTNVLVRRPPPQRRFLSVP